MLQAELFRSQETTSVENLPPPRGGGGIMLLLPAETSSYGAPLPSSFVWTPESIPSYLDDNAPSEEEVLAKNASELFHFSVRQLIQRERASFEICKSVLETRDDIPTAIRVGSDYERLQDQRWLQVSRTLEIFRSFEVGWDGHDDTSAPNQASIAVAQTLLQSLQLAVAAPRIMIDAEGDVVLTWDLDNGSIFLTVEPSRLHLLIKGGEVVESEEVEYEGPIPKSVLSRLPRLA